MSKKWIICAAAAAACASIAAHPVHNKIAAMPDAGKNALFAKLLASESPACSTVKRTFFQGFDSAGAAHWSVQCAGATAYQVMIENNTKGTSKAMDCQTLQLLGASCFKKY